MTVLEITQPDNPILRKKVAKVTSFDDKFQTLVDNMIETMMDAPGVGLAGPQVGENKRVIVVHLPVDEDEDEEGEETQVEEGAGEIYVIANPKIIKTSKTTVSGVEGCLSIPGYVGSVDRYDMVVVTGQDREGKPFRIKANGWLARIFQHEIDHLDGRLFIDLATRIWEMTEKDEDGNPIERDRFPWESQVIAAMTRIQREQEEQETAEAQDQ